MGIAAWEISLFVLSLLWRGGEGWLTLISCEPTISVYCPRPNFDILHIINANVTASLGVRFLEQCNAHKKECHVENTDNECVEVTYWCQTKREKIEIGKSTTKEIHVNLADSTEMSLMSEGYADGKSLEAQNIFCNINAGNNSHCSSTMDFYIRDLAPFIDSKEYCLNLNSGPPICSGVQQFNEYYARSHMYAKHLNIGHFNLSLARNATVVPMVRFWIAINVKRHEYKYRACIATLECTSKPVTLSGDQTPKGPKADSLKTTTKGGPSSNTIIPVLIVFCCLTVFFAAAFGWAMITKRRSSNQAGLPAMNVAMAHGDEDYLVNPHS